MYSFRDSAPQAICQLREMNDTLLLFFFNWNQIYTILVPLQPHILIYDTICIFLFKSKTIF